MPGIEFWRPIKLKNIVRNWFRGGTETKGRLRLYGPKGLGVENLKQVLNYYLHILYIITIFV